MPLPTSLRPLLRTTPTIAQIPNRSLLYVHGSQATDFLNGVLASTVPNPPRGPFFSTFLSAQGRVIHDVFVYYKRNQRGHDGYVIEYDGRPSEAPSLLLTLKRYILRSKVRIEDVSSQYDVWATWGSSSSSTSRQWTHSRSGIIEPLWPTEPVESPWSDGSLDSLRLRDRRAPGMGTRLIMGKGEKPGEASTHDLASHDDYTLHRVLHGVPEGNIDIAPMHAFPMESNLDIMGGLDFRKGCYVGQELTVRTYHTGILRKRILPVALKHDGSRLSTEQLEGLQGSDVRPTLKEGLPSSVPRIRGTGKLLTITPHGIGLALMRLDQVKLAEKGVLDFSAAPSWKVEHWWPDWWPKETTSEDSADV